VVASARRNPKHLNIRPMRPRQNANERLVERSGHVQQETSILLTGRSSALKNMGETKEGRSRSRPYSERRFLSKDRALEKVETPVQKGK